MTRTNGSNGWTLSKTPEQIAARFWSKAKLGFDGCMIWQSPPRSDGYGQFTVKASRRTTAHRFAYELLHGPVPRGLQVCHHCDTPLCVNPAHLFVGTQKDNCVDAMRKGRNARGVTHGRSKLTPEIVTEARLLHSYGASIRGLARRFMVAKKTMTDAINGTHWKSA